MAYVVRHVRLFIAVLLPFCAHACIWDADTLSDERKKKPELAELILGAAPAWFDPKPLRERIVKLKAEARENDPGWWNDLAGAHLRLGEAAEAAKILEPLVSKFPNDYGIHANLGTAYHLLGRYAEAERHIARDLEINPEAHFGLEKYHLALLRYLNRDAEFQKEHVYLEAWTHSLAEGASDAFSYPHLSQDSTNAFDEQFSRATNLLEGVMYMATLNQQQPACWVMLGLVCVRHGQADLNLGKGAFERAIRLGSPQRAILEARIAAIDKHIQKAHGHRRTEAISVSRTLALFVGVPALALACFAWWRWRKKRRAVQRP